VIIATGILLGLLLVTTFGVTQQISSLIDSYPEYEENITAKIFEYQELGRNGMIEKFQAVTERIENQLELAQKKGDSAPEIARNKEIVVPQPVKIVEEGPFSMSKLWSFAGPLLEPIANLGFVLVLVIFMLINREDMRDRLISLIGTSQLTDTTRALEDAGYRVSRYLLIQLLINCAYGLVVSIGLWFFEVPYPLLWGFFAALLRYIPYLGAWLAAILPISLSLLISPEWSITLKVISLFVALELITNMILEPLLYGRGIGVSQTVLLIAVAFWTWLWGPVGLILASPLTVCLVVMSRYIPNLKFIDTLLSDRPALSPVHRYYQRLLANDEDEAFDVLESHLANNQGSLASTFDEIVAPALALARADLYSSKLDKNAHKELVDLNNKIVNDLSEVTKDLTEKSISSAMKSRKKVLLMAARDDIDAIAVQTLAKLVDSDCLDVYVITPGVMVSEVVELIEEKSPDVLAIISIPPGGITHIRHVCKRVQSRFPDLRIIIGRLGLHDEYHDMNKQQLSQISSGSVEFNLGNIISKLKQLSTLD
jgi:predicted PurR-regulated permease PerM